MEKLCKELGMNCNVCVKKYVKTRPIVTCENCAESACKECYMQYEEKFHCMYCKTRFSETFMKDNFGKRVFDELIKQKLFENEKEKLKTSKIKLIKEEIKKKIAKEIRVLEKEILKLEGKISELEGQIEEVNFTSVITCECGGAIIGEECITCNKQKCDKCKEIKEENHICDENIIKNMKIIEKETKPCPGCDTRIYKIDGCDHMWCVKCKTKFSWMTGERIVGNFHNPHHREAMWGRELFESRCGRVIEADIRRFSREMQQLGNYILNVIRNGYYLLRLINEDNEDIRMKFVMQLLDEKTFKNTIYKRHKNNELIKNSVTIFDTYTSIMTELIYRYEAVGTHKKYEIQNNEKKLLILTEMQEFKNITEGTLNELFENSDVPVSKIEKVKNLIGYSLEIRNIIQ